MGSGSVGVGAGDDMVVELAVCCVVIGVLAGVEFDGMVAVVAVVGMLKGCGMVLTSECRLVMLGIPIRCCEEAGGSLHSS